MIITTDAQAILWLAQMEVECQHTSATLKCCSGSTKVRRFPGLMRECWYCHGAGYRDTSDLQWSNDVGCSECGGVGRRDDGNMVKGTGLIPIPVADAVLYLMGQLEFWELDHFQDERDGHMYYEVRWYGYAKPAPTIIQAIARAIAAAEE